MATIRIKRGSSQNLSAAQTSLSTGEPVFTVDTGKLYVYDGTRLIEINPDLPEIGAATPTQAGLLSGADKGKLDAMGSASLRSVGLAAGDLVELDAGGKLPASAMPALALTDVFSVANEAAMLALNAQPGDVAIRSDIKTSFILSAAPATAKANWLTLQTPECAVLSVAGRTGAVTLTKSDVGLSNVSNESKTAMLTSPALTGVPTTPTAAVGSNTTQVASCAFVLAQGFMRTTDAVDGGTF